MIFGELDAGVVLENPNEAVTPCSLS